jgi:hypothetical protein
MEQSRQEEGDDDDHRRNVNPSCSVLKLDRKTRGDETRRDETRRDDRQKRATRRSVLLVWTGHWSLGGVVVVVLLLLPLVCRNRTERDGRRKKNRRQAHEDGVAVAVVVSDRLAMLERAVITVCSANLTFLG